LPAEQSVAGVMLLIEQSAHVDHGVVKYGGCRARVSVVLRPPLAGALWGAPGLMDSGSGCNIEPEVSIGYYREEAAEDLYA